MVRKTDMRFLRDFCRMLGLRQVNRFAGQFTEAYTSIPTRVLKRLICGFNVFYFKSIGLPGPAMGNIIVFEKAERAN